MRSRSVRALVVCALMSLVSSFPSADTATQALPFSQDWSNTGLITADDNWAGVPGIIGYRGDSLVSSTGVNPQTVLAESAGTGAVVDVNANLTTPNTFATGGVAEFHLGDPVVALQGSGYADAPHIVVTASTSGLSNIRVAYNLRDIDGSADNSIQPVALQFRIGTTGNYTNVPAGFVADASSGPTLATLVTPINVALPAAADNQAVIQIRILTTDAVGSDEWIGVDDISVTGSGTPGDAAPAFASSTPAGGGLNVPVDTLIGVTFTESVNATASAFTLVCGGSPQAFAQSPSPNTTITLTPTAALPNSSTCVVTVTANQVTDLDADDPPDELAANASFSFTTAEAPPSSSTSVVVISQLYGGGGNSGATFNRDFIELYNRGNAVVDITGWSVQYSAAANSAWTGVQPLAGTIAPGEYYLVALATNNASVGSALPAANVDGDINMSGTTGKVALVHNATPLSGCPAPGAQVEDLVGYGTANCREGTTNAAAPSNTTALFRLLGGATDTDRNNADFETRAPSPRRTAPFVEVGPSVASTNPISNSTIAPRDATIEVAFSESVDVVGAWFDITCATSGGHNDATFATNGDVRYITPNVNFLEGEQCTVTVFKDQVHDVDADDSGPNTDTLAANYVWSFTVATGTEPPFPTSVHLTMGNPSGAAADQGQPNDFLLEKAEFALSYNRSRGGPNWVSWHLSSHWVGTLQRDDTFRADPAVPADWYRVQGFDYSGSGFDRGHMVPNADRDKETARPINQATFLMSNIIPQTPDNNQGPWANMENDLRTLLSTNELYIVAGGVGIGGTGSNGPAATIANGQVTVPAFTWKAVLVLEEAGGDDTARVTCSTRTIAVIMPNIQGIRNDDWHKYLVNVDEIETKTGYNLFSNLPGPIQRCVEEGINGDNPPLVKDDQTIDFPQPADRNDTDPPFTVSATGGASGNPVTFVASGACSSGGVNGATITIVSPGLCSITASQAGNDLYNAATHVTRILTVHDTTAPSIGAVTTTPNNLGAPNHKMLDVTVSYTATDFTGAPACSVSVSSNEPVNGVGDGNTSIDWRVIDPHHVQLRAERSGLGSGRIYTITVRCTDAAGNASIATGTVRVAK